MDSRVVEQVRRWRDELLDLSKRNRLLNFRHLKVGTLEIVDPLPVGVLEHLLETEGEGWYFRFPPEKAEDDNEDDAGLDQSVVRLSNDGEEFGQDVQDGPCLTTNKPRATDLRNALRTLSRATSQEFLDKGIWILYLSLGMLEWEDSETGDHLSSPVVLQPVNLVRESPAQEFRLVVTEGERVINPALMLKLEKDYDIVLQGLDVDQSLNEVLANVRLAVSSQSSWKVADRTVLARFSFQKEVMYQDLRNNEDQIIGHPVIQSLASHEFAEHAFSNFEVIPENELDERDPPEDRPTVLDADSSQRQCVEAAARSASFVMDGPPGTGKSQTIANMIAELMRLGKRVLFVSEKAAALDVVQERLNDVGLESYLFELCDQRRTRKAVAEMLAGAMLERPRVSGTLSAPDLSALRTRRQELSEYAVAMNEIREPIGRSLYDIAGRASSLSKLPQAPVSTLPTESLTAAALVQMLGLVQELTRAWGPVQRGDNFLWRDLVDSTYDASLRREVTQELELAHAALSVLEDLVSRGIESLQIHWAPMIDCIERLTRLIDLLPLCANAPSHWITSSDLDGVNDRLPTLKAEVSQAISLSEVLVQLVGEHWAEVDLEILREGVFASETVKTCLLDSPEVALFKSDELVSLESLCQSIITLVPELRDRARRVGESFGLSGDGLDLKRCKLFVELGKLASTTHPPLPDWLNPALSSRITEACTTLRRLATAVQSARDPLTSIFEDSILSLDIDGLMTRFTTVHHGLGKLRRAYREDKATLLPHVRARRLTPEALAHLSAAKQWKQVSLELTRSEVRHSSILGTYYEGTETDFDALDAAVKIANEAIELVGPELDSVLLGEVFTSAKAALVLDMRATEKLMGDLELSMTQVNTHIAAALSTGNLDHIEAMAKQLEPLLPLVVQSLDEVAKSMSQPVSVGLMHELLRRRDELEVCRASLDGKYSGDTQLFGTLYQGVNTNWGVLQEVLESIVQVRNVLGGAVDESTAIQLLQSRLRSEPLQDALSKWNGSLDAVLQRFQDERRHLLREQCQTEFTLASRLLSRLTETIDDVYEWFSFSDITVRLRNQGLGQQLDFVMGNRAEAAVLVGVFERSLLEGFVDTVMKRDQRLRRSRSADRSAIVKEFRNLDRQLFKLGSSRVIEACNSRRPDNYSGQAGTIMREAEKKRRHMPIRDLLGATATATQLIKPCFLMTPLTVSQFLLPSMHFDTVIFDEASQVRPADAINAIYRGDNLIVAGDQRQLPPTSFFERGGDDENDEYEEGQLEDYESVLDLCKGTGQFPNLPLRWHYRSKHESLITYSNYAFYGGGLVTFPSAAQEGSDIGIELIKVNGVYRRGGPRDNPIEADAVVDRIFLHAREHPNLTLGVVAFSEAQASAIEDALDRKRRTMSEFDSYFEGNRLRGVFVKNLENAQGDERDIIIFSIGYGPDEAGRFTLNFGPLNKEGGERRLNVAITRARRRVEIVSSVSAEDFVGEMNTPGVRHLRRYLDFAERGVGALSLEISETELDAEGPFEEEVIAVLQGWGYDVVPQVGHGGYRIDIGVRDPSRPGRFLLGIECDGVRYHSSKVARDRDRLRHEQLEALGWSIYHIWGTAWYRERASAEVRLRDALAVAQAQSNIPRSPAGSQVPVAIEVRRVNVQEARPWLRPYQPVNVIFGMQKTILTSPNGRVALYQFIQEVVKTEGPVTRAIIMKRVRKAWGAGRMGELMQAIVDATTKDLSREKILIKDGKDSFAFLGQHLIAARHPVEGIGDSKRSPLEVPLSEIRFAFLCIIRDAGAIKKSELYQICAKSFGWSRSGSEVTGRLNAAFRAIMKTDMVAGDASALRLA